MTENHIETELVSEVSRGSMSSSAYGAKVNGYNEQKDRQPRQPYTPGYSNIHQTYDEVANLDDSSESTSGFFNKMYANANINVEG